MLLRLGPFRWRAVSPWRAARVAAGVVVPLAIGWWSGHIDLGAFAALGALPAGMVSFQGVTRSRVAAVAAASVGMAVSTFVGATLANGAPWVLVLRAADCRARPRSDGSTSGSPARPLRASARLVVVDASLRARERLSLAPGAGRSRLGLLHLA